MRQEPRSFPYEYIFLSKSLLFKVTYKHPLSSHPYLLWFLKRGKILVNTQSNLRGKFHKLNAQLLSESDEILGLICDIFFFTKNLTNVTRPIPSISNSFIKIKTNFIKPFQAPQRSVEIKI